MYDAHRYVSGTLFRVSQCIHDINDVCSGGCMGVYGLTRKTCLYLSYK